MSETADMLEGLDALRSRDGLSGRVVKRCVKLIERLQTPVRVAVFGLPGAGKAPVLNALVDAQVLAPDHQAAPARISHAAAPRMTVTTEAGDTVSGDATLPIALGADLLYAEIGLPLPTLQQMSLLNVVTEPSPEECRAALLWAAQRCDIAIWCTRTWSAPEQTLWQSAPDALKNHALLVATNAAEATRIAQTDQTGLSHGLCAIAMERDMAMVSTESAEMLRQKIAAMIAEARREDLDAAYVLLAQQGADEPRLQPVSTPESPARPDSPELRLVTRNDPPAPGSASCGSAPDSASASPMPYGAREALPAITPEAPDLPAAARATLSRMLFLIRAAARDLLSDAPQDMLEDAAASASLVRLEEAFEALLERAEDEPAIRDTCPGVVEMLEEANELMLLLRIEGTATEAAEAAVLLAQVRDDVVRALAA
ncbi:hypothetical protein [Cognatishimia sp. F0-27]|uniref:hypothetical protein n=1 Tax=Cognatishimia sp. F0-27 TaxID=2816855 RepID=UPI001D0C2616|nr:hypothetical protein [Cognatishimia sp. F0-27]MCC1493802.1 hypothetical protein [Cognatishimia sp. F0-27]